MHRRSRLQATRRRQRRAQPEEAEAEEAERGGLGHVGAVRNTVAVAVDVEKGGRCQYVELIDREILNLIDPAGIGHVDAPAALVVVTDGERRTMPSADTLRAGYDLSDAEIAICRLLLDGASVVNIAAQRAVAVRTVRTVRTVRAQLESIYRKTGTGRQANSSAR